MTEAILDFLRQMVALLAFLGLVGSVLYTLFSIAWAERPGRAWLAGIAGCGIFTLLAAAALAESQAEVPRCRRLSDNHMVACYSASKIDAALAIVKRRGGSADRDFIISIEINRGKFENAQALAEAVLTGGY